ncbi:MAG TPA: hypothetical protein ACFYD2_05805 [Candidatus Avalokitesvara rifleensis]|uniref:hypothetical protein n=1 Tax=Candidatus Avalokitesvara rifleensis TaxID=3367620 RepID=UPI002713371F|nr:hypothetical protein [Candidatus Brocadiales bacterium]
MKAKTKISRRKSIKKWTASEISTLKREYPSTDTGKLAKKLRRSLEAVRFKAKRYGLKKTNIYMELLYDKARKSAPKKKTVQKRR